LMERVGYRGDLALIESWTLDVERWTFSERLRTGIQ
jgi:hypothetical protein